LVFVETVHMKKKLQILVPCVLTALGVALFVYGADFHRKEVYSEDGTSVVATVEFGLIREVTVGGIRRDELGNIRLTYTGKAPSACPT
jgi:hypothetical protein